jgi:hypothetical protein
MTAMRIANNELEKKFTVETAARQCCFETRKCGDETGGVGELKTVARSFQLELSRFAQPYLLSNTSDNVLPLRRFNDLKSLHQPQTMIFA